MMDLFLIRHGHTDGDRLDVIECNADFDLTDQGREQARKLVGYLEHLAPFDVLYSSGLKRAVHTAERISERFGLDLNIDARLNEKNVGDMAGMPRKEAFNKYPAPVGGLKIHQKMGGGTGESMLEMQFRVTEFFSELLERHPDDRVIVLSHGGTLDLALKHLLSAGPANTFLTGNVGIHHLVIDQGQVRVCFLNRDIL